MSTEHVELLSDDGGERIAAAFAKLDAVIERAQRIVMRGAFGLDDETSARADVE